ncbi:membrane-associated progesterone receptor component 1 [Drosophila innubila]|uniref:membrane-associated progesterone receptor component 1 n=1 Tax=Drosophila innubila TaxID=198719 RepID=UPI00148CA753|nr:membrane-associated progesterone receptor component 1 [Drosophila innubila]
MMPEKVGQSKVGEEKLPWYNNLYKSIRDAPINLTLLFVSTFVFYKVVTTTRNRRNEHRVQISGAGPKANKDYLPALSRDFTVKELREYNGTRDDGRILLAVNHKVYDVSTAMHFYGKDGAYPHYAGSDISRNLINIHKNDRDEFDDLNDLTEAQMTALISWDQQYAEKYPLVGHLVPEYEEEQLEYSNIEEDEEKEMICVANDINTQDQFMM